MVVGIWTVEIVAVCVVIVASAFVGFAAMGAIDARLVASGVARRNGIACDGVPPQHVSSLLLGIIRIHSLVQWMFQFPFLYPLLKVHVLF